MRQDTSLYEKCRKMADNVEQHLKTRLPEVGVDGHVDIRPSRLGSTVRVRVISRAFDGMDVFDREELVEPLIEELPEETQRAVIGLVLSGLREYESPTADDFLIRSQNESFDQPLDNLAAPYAGSTDA